MRVESLASRLEFNERRARALESAVVYKPLGRGAPAAAIATAGGPAVTADAAPPAPANQPDRHPASRRCSRARPASAGEDPASAAVGVGDDAAGAGGGPAAAAVMAPPGGTPQPAATPRDGSTDSRCGRRAVFAAPAPTGAHSGRRQRSTPDRRTTPLRDDGRTTTAAGHEWRRTRRAVKLAVVVQRYGQVDQRRRGTPRALHRRASRASRRGRGPDHVRHRLRHLAQRAAGRRRAGQRRAGSPLPRRSTNATRSVFGRRSATRLHAAALTSATSSTGSTPKDRRARRSSITSRGTPATTTSACSSAIATTTRIYGARAAADRAILVPTAERDAAIGLAIFQPLFRGVRALMYNSPEERAMIQAVSGNHRCAGVVVGVGSDVPRQPAARIASARNTTSRARSRFTSGASTRTRAARSSSTSSRGTCRIGYGKLSLVLVGNSLLPIPTHPRIRHLGFLDDADKFDAMAAADLLIMPSYFESLSMVALEAWALGRPVLANGRCDVLKGQCIRSNAGLYYENVHGVRRRRFRRIERNRWLRGLARPERPAVLSRPLRLAGDRAEVPRHVRTALTRTSRPRPSNRCPAGSIGAGRTCRPPRRCLRSCRAGPVNGPSSARRPEMGVIRIHQVLATLGYGDAIGHEVLGIQRVLRAAGYESEIFVETADSPPRVADARLSRARRLQPSRQPAPPSLFAGLESVAHRVCAARPNGAHLPQHHAAGVLRRRASVAGATMLPRTAGAAGVRRPLRPGARRFGVQPAGPRSARVSTHRRAAGRAGFLAPRPGAELAGRAAISTTTWTNILFVGRDDRRTRRSRI